MMIRIRLLIVSIILIHYICQGFVTRHGSKIPFTPSFAFEKKRNKVIGSSSIKGFGSNSNAKSNGFEKGIYEKTYNQKSFRTLDGKDDFFTRNSDWLPLFASVTSSVDVLAKYIDMTSYSTTELEYSDMTPWLKLPSMPVGPDKDKHMQAIVHVLDKTQMALMEIPEEVDDDQDLNFVEEGRRILVMSRFHVLDEVKQNDFGPLFQACWSEIYCLINDGTPGTGSLIILDKLEENVDLSHFVHTNIRLPLQWLGIGEDCLEVANFTRGKKCIRLIHKLGVIPDLRDRDRALEEEQKRKGEN